MNDELNEREAWAWAHANRVLVNEYRNGSVAELGPFGASGPSPHAAINALRRTMKLSRPPVEAQAKGEACQLRESEASFFEQGRNKDAEHAGNIAARLENPQPTPPAAETREAREWWIRIRCSHFETLWPSKETAQCDYIGAEVVHVREVLPHPEPQAPRVSEGATKAIRQGIGMLASAVKCGEQWSHEHQRKMDAALDGLAVLSQPAQGERKTERDMTDKEAREWKAWASVELNRRGEYFEPVVYGISYGSETVALNKFRKALKTRAEFGSAKEFDAAKRAKGREEG